MAALSLRYRPSLTSSIISQAWTPAVVDRLHMPRYFAMAALRMPFLRGLLELFPPFLLAVPKKKVSHSRKAMRSANKGLKDKTNIVNCPACGAAKLAHHLCPRCYSELSRGWKAKAREESTELSPVA